MIDKELFDKSRVDLIANKILKTCNYFHLRSKNTNSVGSKKGKTMITNGLTVEDFLKKHKLNH